MNIIPNKFFEEAETAELVKLDENFQYVLDLINNINTPRYWSKVTTNTLATSGDSLLVDTTLNPLTITLPAMPTLCNYVTISTGSDFSVNNVSVNPGVNTIDGVSGLYTISMKQCSVLFVYDGTTWKKIISATTMVKDDMISDMIVYPVWSTTTNNNVENVNTSTAKLFYNPATGTFSSLQFDSLSDRNKKTNIVNIPDALDKIQQLNGVTFNWVEGGKKSVGLIAQDVEAIYPELVTDSTGTYTLNYNGVIGILVEAIKELSAEVKELKEKLDASSS